MEAAGSRLKRSMVITVKMVWLELVCEEARTAP